MNVVSMSKSYCTALTLLLVIIWDDKMLHDEMKYEWHRHYVLGYYWPSHCMSERGSSPRPLLTMETLESESADEGEYCMYTGNYKILLKKLKKTQTNGKTSCVHRL